VAVIHGGPGAAGEVAEVAEVLSADRGVLEPLQTGRSLQLQVEELKSQLQECSKPPLTLIGFSWGAWLSLILAAQYPHLVSRLILIGCGPFEEKYAQEIMEKRLSRLSEAERDEAICLIAALQDQNDTLDEAKKQEKNREIVRMGELFRKTDAFDPIEIKATQSDSIGNHSILPESVYDNSMVQRDSVIYQAVWKDASLLRQKGELLDLCQKVQCPVVALHGDYDPHPAEGVRKPLQTVLKNFRFILLEDCGHKPWIEKRAMGKFYSILREELNQV
jgi:pimeloyl-ACP methyl ester carboxylesterase